MKKERLLECVGSTEESSFNELCRALEGDCPTEKTGWAALFRLIENCEAEGLLEVTRLKGKIDTVQLTGEGADLIRGMKDSKRGLFR